ncbi:hypothetical protein LTR36_001151 [Oleoguttula mirabilis]|uniref:Arabinan endo-1,5-alpha-L-arabinosidase n=1 Tax=Oleoguttula mirabilis TaxID=1507867 RepID=A0AAV9JQ15_9PEZI|nr:hypothetical protein LTR36_001151 [Oleoguttula mirabilis]
MAALFLLRALFLLPALVSAITYPAVGECTGNCTGGVHDPNVVLRDDGTYFRFTTNGRVNIATAKHISGPWTYKGAALPSGSTINLPGRNDIWAPDVMKSNGVYYMTYAVSAMLSQHSDIGVATSKTMEPGSWMDHGSIGVPSGSWNRIDPNLMQVSPTSTPYLTWGSFWTDIWQIEMANPPLKVLAGQEPLHLEQNTTARPQGRPTGPSEGSYQFRWTVGGETYYYLFFSSGGCCNKPPNLAPAGEEYKIMVCRSTSPTGPFVGQLGHSCLSQNAGTIVLQSHDDMFAAGGQGVMYDPNVKSVVVYYHYLKPSVGYDYDQFQFGWNKLNFDSGWPEVVA